MSLPTQHLKTLVFRAIHPGWAFSPRSGEGAARHGGRFNPVGRPALYTSCDPITAIAEAQQGFVRKFQPMTLCAYQVDCQDVVDLSDPETLDTLKASPADLACPWEDLHLRGETPPSWQIANDLIARGAAAIIVRSFALGLAPNNRNVVFWKWGADLPHSVVVVDDHQRLPIDDSSWQR